MIIDLTNTENIIIDTDIGVDVEQWFIMNYGSIMNYIRSYIRNYGWAFGGAFQMRLDIERLYKEHPCWDVEADEEISSVSLMAA